MAQNGTSSSEEQIKASVEQGNRVKQLGLQIGGLEQELHPPSPEKKLEDGILYLRMDAIDYRKHLKPEKPEHAKQILQLNQKIERLNQIEQDYKNKSKSVEQLLKDLEQVRAQKIP